MSGIKDLAKGGWHPKGKDGGKETWRGDFKGINEVAGWMGKKQGKSTTEEGLEHRSAPLSSLKDPDSFGPPPKRYGGGTGGVTYTNTSGITQSGGGIGSALTPEQVRIQQERREREEEENRRLEEETAKPASAALPYRRDTTGLSTDNLPTPPIRRVNEAMSTIPASLKSAAKPKPSLPPRLPPRSAAAPLATEPQTSANHDNIVSQVQPTPLLNQSAIDRLRSRGISVSGFGIGKATTSTTGSADTSTPVNELQTRFSKIGAGSNNIAPPTTPSPTTPTTGGTTWVQKRAALQTAQNFNKDPSSISLSDARAAASTANNFRERHGEQVAKGWQSANGLNQRYGIADRISAYSEGASQDATNVPKGETFGGLDSAVAKKAPPPPPPKKKQLAEIDAHSGTAGGIVPPPPLPIGSKPRPT